MKFSEKLKMLRKARKFTQAELGELSGMTARTIYQYENDDTLPRRRNAYKNLATALDVPEDFLKNEHEDDFQKLNEYAYGDQAKLEAERIVSEVQGLFTSGQLCEADKDGLMRALQELYWETKEIHDKRQEE